MSITIAPPPTPPPHARVVLNGLHEQFLHRKIRKNLYGICKSCRANRCRETWINQSREHFDYTV